MEVVKYQEKKVRGEQPVTVQWLNVPEWVRVCKAYSSARTSLEQRHRIPATQNHQSGSEEAEGGKRWEAFTSWLLRFLGCWVLTILHFSALFPDQSREVLGETELLMMARSGKCVSRAAGGAPN